MSHSEVNRALKDPEYRQGLSQDERAKLPLHPAGLVELQDAELEAVSGGRAIGPDWIPK